MDRDERSASVGADMGHEEAWGLLPWLANGTLDGRELVDVLDHLKTCTSCLDELRYLPELRSARAEFGDDSGPEAQAGFERLMQRIDGVEGRTAESGVVRFLDAAPRWARWTVLGQAAAIVLLVGALAVQWPLLGVADQATSFRTLSESRPATCGAEVDRFGVRLVFHRSATLEEVKTLMLQESLQMIDGPNTVGAFLVRSLSVGDRAAATAMLEEVRGSALVVLAEPVGDWADAP